MKSVTFSDIQRARDGARFLPALWSVRGLMVAAMTLSLGLPALMMAFHLLDPTAPLGYIVLPVLLGGVLPMMHVLPGRLQVMTRFDACHLVGTLDAAMDKLGYTPSGRAPGAVHYRARTERWPQWQHKEIVVAVRPHALDVTGPVAALRELRRQMAC